MKYKYQYIGTSEVNVPYVGTFQPGEIKEVDQEINHPDFIEVKETTKKKGR